MVPCVEGDGGGGGVSRAFPVVLRGRAAVGDDLVEVGQVLRGGVDALPDALVVAGPPGVGDVHGTAAVGVERDGPEAAADAAGGHGRKMIITQQSIGSSSNIMKPQVEDGKSLNFSLLHPPMQMKKRSPLRADRQTR